MNQKYFDTIFALTGDQTVIPDALQVTGYVSFNQGWTFDYQRDQTTDPLAKPIDRSTMNYLFSVITAAIKQYQENSIPEFITSANNGGTAFSYGHGVAVLWSATGVAPFEVYISMVAANTSIPHDGSGNWLPLSMALNSFSAVADIGAANAYVCTFAPALLAPAPGVPFWVKIAHTNTGASTLNAAGTVSPLVGGAHAALQGGELVANGWALIVWNATIASYVLLECGGAASQLGAGSYLPTATPLNNSTNVATTAFANATGAVVGTVRNLKMYLAAANASATFTADEVVVETALGGAPWRLAAINHTINTATVGLNGMDVGAAPTSGYLAIYEIFNPTTGVKGLLGTNATLAAQPNVYGGANIPAGFAASGLLAVVPTTAGGLIAACEIQDRDCWTASVSVLNTTTPQAALTSLSIAAAVPLNAKYCSYDLSAQNNTAATGNVFQMSSASIGMGSKFRTWYCPAANVSDITSYENLALNTPQTMWYTANPNSGTLTTGIAISGYRI